MVFVSTNNNGKDEIETEEHSAEHTYVSSTTRALGK